MQKELHEFIQDRLMPLTALSNASSPVAADHAAKPTQRFIGLERDYLATCQKLEELVERKRHAEADKGDIASLHQELCLIGSRIQREPHDPSHDEDYLAVLRRIKETLWRKIEAENLKGEFQKLHFELLGLGHKLDLEHPPAAQQPAEDFLPIAPDDMNLSDVERQIAELQAQIRSLHDHH